MTVTMMTITATMMRNANYNNDDDDEDDGDDGDDDDDDKDDYDDDRGVARR